MEIIKKRISDLKSSGYNPRMMSKNEMDKLKRSIEEFGYVEPIIWNKRTDRIVGGHQRIKAMKDIGMDEVEVVVVDLDEKREKTLNIALNKIQGKWDLDKLSVIFGELREEDIIRFTGFDYDEIDAVISGILQEEPFDKEINGGSMDISNKCPKCGYRW